MATTTALMPSPTFQSAFSPYTDSPSSPAPYSLAYRGMQRNSETSDPSSLHPPPSPYPATVDPSPVESNNSTSTDATDIEVDDNDDLDDLKSPDIEIISPASGAGHDAMGPLPVRIDTESASNSQADADDPQSVIHAPKGFQQFSNSLTPHEEDPSSPHSQITRPQEGKQSTSPLTRHRSTSSPSAESENTITSPETPEGSLAFSKRNTAKDTTPINTQVPQTRTGVGSTPRASTQEEAEEEWRRSSLSSNQSEGKAEGDPADASTAGEPEEVESIGTTLRNLSNNAEQEVAALRTALSECWTLCNTLANLSSVHRKRMFSFSGAGEVQEQAWKTCWKLCQKLYESRDEDHASQVKPTLELCREFCQALFEVRVRGDEVTDSILRVSFELNNHLYNTHDRNLPDAFRERTLDFYLTMCHRLMKQHTSLPEETDALLRACWSLAEMLFSLRQNNLDQKPVDEELLGSAVQACWELCDLFREGWTQVRPDRGTPRPVQRVFPASSFATGSNYAPSQTGPMSRPASSLSRDGTYHTAQDQHLRSFVPETPTTIFDDRDEASPAEASVPNILVLGPDHPSMQHRSTQARWSSSTSLSNYSESSQRTATSARPAQAASTRGIESSQTSPKSIISPSNSAGEDPHLIRLKGLILKAAQNVGYPRNTSNPPPLPVFIKTLTPTAFGAMPWQIALFESYRKLVLTDPTLRDPAGLPMARRFTAHEIARAVMWIGRSQGYDWLGGLFRSVFGFGPEEAGNKKGVGFQL